MGASGIGAPRVGRVAERRRRHVRAAGRRVRLGHRARVVARQVVSPEVRRDEAPAARVRALQVEEVRVGRRPSPAQQHGKVRRPRERRHQAPRRIEVVSP